MPASTEKDSRPTSQERIAASLKICYTARKAPSRLKSGSLPAWLIMRHLVSSPENGPVILTYGCSDCHWRYTPKTPEEACNMSWNAQFLFEEHDCAKLRMGQPEGAPTNPQKRSA